MNNADRRLERLRVAFGDASEATKEPTPFELEHAARIKRAWSHYKAQLTDEERAALEADERRFASMRTDGASILGALRECPYLADAYERMTDAPEDLTEAVDGL